jgi:hypothetical protein
MYPEGIIVWGRLRVLREGLATVYCEGWWICCVVIFNGALEIWSSSVRHRNRLNLYEERTMLNHEFVQSISKLRDLGTSNQFKSLSSEYKTTLYPSFDYIE